MSQSLPAVYKSILFRSQTEVRHAVFLDALDIEWAYEEQGYRSRGTCYLPDFKMLGALGIVYLEVKGRFDAESQDVMRWRDFAAERPQPSRAALLIGAPALDLRTIVIGGDENAADPGDGPWETDDFTWRPCQSGEHFDLVYPGHFKSKFAEHPGCEQKFGGLALERIEDAVTAASAYQFGRRPVPVVGG